MLQNVTLKFACRLSEAGAGKFEVTVIRAGWSENNRYYPAKLLKENARKFNGVKVYSYILGDIRQHIPDRAENIRGHLAGNIIGVLRNSYWDEGSQEIRATLELLRPEYKFLLQASIDDPSIVGFSVDMTGKAMPFREGSREGLKILSIENVNELTMVTHPAAGGRARRMVAQILESIQSRREIEMNEYLPILLSVLESWEGIDPETLKELQEAEEKDQVVDALVKLAEKGLVLEDVESELLKRSKEADDPVPFVDATNLILEARKKKAPKKEKYPYPYPKPGEAGTKESEKPEKEEPEPKPESESISKLEEEVKRLKIEKQVSRILRESKLPEIVKDRIYSDWDSGNLKDLEAVQKAIERERDYYARLTEAAKKENSEPVKITENQFDRLQKAMDGLFEGQPIDGVQPFRSLHDAYRKITGKGGMPYEMAEKIMESLAFSFPATSAEGEHQRVIEALRLKEATQADFSVLFGTSMTKQLIKYFTLPDFQMWKKVVGPNVTSLNDMRQQDRVLLGGLIDLTTVAEGQTYPAATGFTEKTRSYTPLKKGRTFQITWEMVLNDDIGALKWLPRHLGSAAGRTLVKFVYWLVAGWDPDDPGTTNYTIDGANMYVAGHSNLGSTALSRATLRAARVAMNKQTDPGSSERLGIEPKYLCVPPDLAGLAHELIKATQRPEVVVAGSGTNEYPSQFTPNEFAAIGMDYIVVPWWTDANDWYVTADPNLHPTIEIGFLGGRQTPEILVQNQPTVGSAFTADVITYKARFVFGGAVLDWRPFYGARVA